jgi:phosphoglucosamine mutase
VGAEPLKVGMAAGTMFTNGDHRHRVVIGKDTRLSGYMIESALVSGFTAVGMDVFQLGPMPTPAVAMLTRSLRADLGVMISASHNPYEDNGIKLFGPDGYKLSDEREMEIEALVEKGPPLAAPQDIGRAKRIDSAQERYIEFAKRTLPRNIRFDGLRVVVDCANGSAYQVAPAALWELGAEVITIGVEPNGLNINTDCGSTSLGEIRKKVREMRADIGIALDGDADRVMIIDEAGHVADGDQIMALFASSWAKSGRLKGGALVATVMSNMGLERYLADQGIALERTDVGDRYVVERMRSGGFNLGGEQSGHIVMTDYATTGDGLLAGLQFLRAMLEADRPASDLANSFQTVPQLLKNVRFGEGQDPLAKKSVKAAIAEAEKALDKDGRLLIRKSGTEPVIRVMAECEDEAVLHTAVDQVVAAVQAATAGP